MSELSKPEVVGLLVHHGRQRQVQRITPFDVQLLSKSCLTHSSREGQAVDLLFVVMIFVFLPVRVEIKPISSVWLEVARSRR